jgi:hypothetical protein
MGTVGGLPFPEGTDKVVDGDNAIQSLARAVDRNPNAIVPAAQVAVPLTAGWVNVATVLYVMAINGQVTLSGRVQRSSGSSNVIGVIPAGYRPPQQVVTVIGTYNNASTTAGPQIFLVIDVNGTITINAATSPAFGTATFVPLHVEFPRGAA